MKLSKKILLIIVSLGITGGISWLLAYSLLHLFSLNFWAVFFLTTLAQLIIPKIWNDLYEKYVIKQKLDEYSAKPYKQYPVQSICQHCGNNVTLELDLDDSEYICGNCHKHNAVHVTFMTAAIQTPINTQVL